MVDLRNHGASPWSEDCSLESMADDLIDTLDAAGVDQATICGHSLGGKVAMAAALRAPHRLSRLIVVDIAPVAYGPTHAGWSMNLEIMDAMLGIPEAALGSRGDADQALVAAGVGVDSPGVRAFLLQNLVPDERRWRFNLRALREAAAKDVYAGFPEQLPPAPATLPVRVISGARSWYAITDEHRKVFERLFPGVEEQTSVIDAGHWVHAEKPAEFIAAVDDFAL